MAEEINLLLSLKQAYLRSGFKKCHWVHWLKRHENVIFLLDGKRVQTGKREFDYFFDSEEPFDDLFGPRYTTLKSAKKKIIDKVVKEHNDKLCDELFKDQVDSTTIILDELNKMVHGLIEENKRLKEIEKQYNEIIKPTEISFDHAIELLQPVKDNVPLTKNGLYKLLKERNVLYNNRKPKPKYAGAFVIKIIMVGPKMNIESHKVLFNKTGFNNIKTLLVQLGYKIKENE